MGEVMDRGDWGQIVLLTILAGGVSFGVLKPGSSLVAAVVSAVAAAVVVFITLVIFFRVRSQR